MSDMKIEAKGVRPRGERGGDDNDCNTIYCDGRTVCIYIHVLNVIQRDVVITERKFKRDFVKKITVSRLLL